MKTLWSKLLLALNMCVRAVCVQSDDDRPVNFFPLEERIGIGKCPHDPAQNNTALLIGE